MMGDDSKELLNEWASFAPSTKEDWLSNCILFNKKFSSPLKICFQQYLMVWGNFKATPMLVLVHYSRSHPITTSSHSMATLLLDSNLPIEFFTNPTFSSSMMKFSFTSLTKNWLFSKDVFLLKLLTAHTPCTSD